MLPLASRVRRVLSSRLNVVLVLVLILVLGGGFFILNKFLIGFLKAPQVLSEVDLPFDAEGPFAILEPRSDGNALGLNIKRVLSYDGISYELAYQSDGIDRGVQGTLDTKSRKSEYSQEILFGTCSKGDTFSTLHCVFDKNVENGTLMLKIQKGNTVYKMNTSWHQQKPDLALGVMVSADGHFVYKTNADKKELTAVGFTIINELSGVPKLPPGKKVFGKVYALNVSTAKTFAGGEVSFELIEAAPTGAVIARYEDGGNVWQLLKTEVSGSNLRAKALSGGIFAVLVASENP